jgi:NADH dehydrogenase FAD-containing subunit
VVGDAALVRDSKGKALPTNAYFNEQHGRIAAQNIYALLKGEIKELQEYRAEITDPLLLFQLEKTLLSQG